MLCPGRNDGEELERSIHDLAALAPAVKSVAVVPVGLTKYREGLTPLRPFTAEEAKKVIATVEHFGDCMLAATGERVVYPADEWYLLADKPIPDEDFYGEMPQLENGVGLIALLRSQFMEALENTTEKAAKGTETLLVTGVAAASIDETIQLFVPGRGPHIRDVGIDSFGVLMGIAILSGIALWKACYKRKQFTGGV